VSKQKSEHVGRFESISNFQNKKEILLSNLSSAKELGKRREKELASLSPPRLISDNTI